MAEPVKVNEVKVDAAKAVAPKVEPVKVTPKDEDAEKKNVAKEDIWLYHSTKEPKLFKKGEVIPDEWELKNRWGWYRDIKNNFQWRKK